MELTIAGRDYAMMQAGSVCHSILDVKKLKKDGSISGNCVDEIIRTLKAGELFVLPVDSIYGIVGLKNDRTAEEIQALTGDSCDNFEIIISNFKMLEETAFVDKFTYDFLKRVWPGEVIVQLKNRGCAYESNLFMRMPRHKYILDIINGVGEPLLYVPARTAVRKMIFSDRDIIRRFKNICSLLIISEFNKNHTLPTLIDISCDRLDIVNEGRVSSDEIKSLYFLGNM